MFRAIEVAAVSRPSIRARFDSGESGAGCGLGMGGSATSRIGIGFEISLFVGSCGEIAGVGDIGSGVNGSTGTMDAGAEEATAL